MVATTAGNASSFHNPLMKQQNKRRLTTFKLSPAANANFQSLGSMEETISPRLITSGVLAAIAGAAMALAVIQPVFCIHSVIAARHRAGRQGWRSGNLLLPPLLLPALLSSLLPSLLSPLLSSLLLPRILPPLLSSLLSPLLLSSLLLLPSILLLTLLLPALLLSIILTSLARLLVDRLRTRAPLVLTEAFSKER